MTLCIERVANGYIIRDDTEEETFVVSEDNEIAVAGAMLGEDDIGAGPHSNRRAVDLLRMISAAAGAPDETTPSSRKMTPAEIAEWHTRGWKADELGSVYAVNAGRYVVSLIVTYEDSKWTDVRDGIENIHSPATAAAGALALTRDSASRSTIWHVFDRLTRQMHTLAQGEFE